MRRRPPFTTQERLEKPTRTIVMKNIHDLTTETQQGLVLLDTDNIEVKDLMPDCASSYFKRIGRILSCLLIIILILIAAFMSAWQVTTTTATPWGTPLRVPSHSLRSIQNQSSNLSSGWRNSFDLIRVEIMSSGGRSDMQTAYSCKEKLIGQISWDDWIASQTHVPQQQRCHSRHKGVCKCRDPSSLNRGDSWQQAFQRNQERANNCSSQLDMVMLGDSLMEFWADEFYLNKPLKQLKGNQDVYRRLFQQPDSTVKAIALGISGDQTLNLLYRLQHGELSDCLQPQLWWICIGTNDYGVGGCNADTILVGVLDLVHEIHQKRPSAEIIINALLPRGKKPLQQQDSDWHELSLVNEYLRCFADGLSWAHFVNDTDLFVTEDQAMVNRSMLSDNLHPSNLGYSLWGNRIASASAGMLK